MAKATLVQKENGKKTAADASSSRVTSIPKFPYATTPNALRKFLQLVPQKPKPPKVNINTLQAWGLKNTNDKSIIRVLKALGLVDSNNEPTERYTEFMLPATGPSVLAAAIREVWAPLFNSSRVPHRDSNEALRNYFNIYSGGSEGTIEYQIQTFKAVCDHADFKEVAAKAPAIPVVAADGGAKNDVVRDSGAAIHIDLHIHLPENKSRRDYEYIFEDIARYIFGRDVGGRADERS